MGNLSDHLKTELGESGRTYVREMLLQGTWLSFLLSSRRLGRVCVLGSDNLPLSCLQDLLSGGTGIGGLREFAVPLIVEYLRRGPNNVVIADDHILRVGDPVLRNHQHVVYGGHIYEFNYDADPGQVRKAVRGASEYPTIMLLTSSECQLRPNENLSEHEVTKLVASGELLLVGAWDQEGFVAAELV